MEAYVYRFENGTLLLTYHKVEEYKDLLVTQGTKAVCWAYMDAHSHKEG
jgi:hypothetical protein